MSNRNYGLGPAAGEYSAEDDNQLQPEDTLIDRGVDDVLDEGDVYKRQTHDCGQSGRSR